MKSEQNSAKGRKLAGLEFYVLSVALNRTTE